jgi:hypothetical protein
MACPALNTPNCSAEHDEVTDMIITLADLTRMSGLDVLDHLEREVAIPIVDGLQAQGDLIVIPAAMLDEFSRTTDGNWREIPPTGIELLRSASGGNPHTLVGEPRTCLWTTRGTDPEQLHIGTLRNNRPAFLIHPEHGGTGIAPGIWVIRRQRERGAARRTGFASSRRDVLVVD